MHGANSSSSGSILCNIVTHLYPNQAKTQEYGMVARSKPN